MCRKVPYYRRIDAKIALAATQRSQNPRREEVRFYWCKEHNAFHLTSKK